MAKAFSEITRSGLSQSHPRSRNVLPPSAGRSSGKIKPYSSHYGRCIGKFGRNLGETHYSQASFGQRLNEAYSVVRQESWPGRGPIVLANQLRTAVADVMQRIEHRCSFFV